MTNIYGIKIVKTHPLATIPKYATEGSSGMDLYTIEDGVIYSKSWGLIKLGLKVELPRIGDMEFQVRPKSGLALKEGITVLNTPGTIDSDYRGELGVIIINFSNEDYYYGKLQKIAQLILCPVYKCNWLISEELSETERGEGGFGSTGLG